MKNIGIEGFTFLKGEIKQLDHICSLINIQYFEHFENDL